MKKTALIKAILAVGVIAALSAGMLGCTEAEEQSGGLTSSPYEVTMHDRPTNGLENSDELISAPENSSDGDSSFEESSEQDVSDHTESLPEESSREQSSSDTSKTESTPREKIREGDVSVIPDLRSKYFVSRLGSALQKNFALVYEAAAGFEKEVRFPKDIPEDDLTTIMFLLNYDCPELFHTKGDYYPIYSAKDPEKISGVGLTYCMTEDMYSQAEAELDRYIGTMIVDLYGKSEYEKEKAVYDKLFYGLTYTETDLYSGSIYGCLLKGRARCEGICKSFMWCMRKLGIECLCVSGSQYWNTSAVYLDHSWNIVKIDGSFYQLDLTLDNVRTEDDPSVEPVPHYGFFNVDDAFMESNRRVNPVFTDIGTPVCSSDKLNYHIQNGLYISSSEDVRERAFEIMESHFRNEELPAVSIKCQDSDTFRELSSGIYEWMNDFLSGVSNDRYKLNTYANELSCTMVIEAIKRE